MASALQVRTIKPSSMHATMRTMLLTQCSAFYWGSPGIGKSEIAMAFANLLGIAFCDVRLSQRDPTDVRGMPVPVKENGETVGVIWVAPSEFPLDVDRTFYRDLEAIDMRISFERLNPTGLNGIHHIPDPQITVRSLDRSLEAILLEKTLTDFTVQLVDKNEAEAVRAKGGDIEDFRALEPHAGRIEYRIVGKAKAVLAFEEMNSAQETILAACYQIIHDRVIADQKLNDDILIIAMGNYEQDRGVAFRMPDPLLNRLVHYHVKMDNDDWIKWALENQQDPTVIGFIQRFPDYLFNHKPGSGQKSYATPRSWARNSKILKTMELDPRIVLDEEELRATIYGNVGDVAGGNFFEFRTHAKDLPTPEDILTGKVTKLMNGAADRTAASYLITNSVLFVLKNENDQLMMSGVDETSTHKDRKAWYAKVDNYIDFAANNFKPEVNVMGIRTALQILGIPISGVHCEKWKLFTARHKKYMMD